MWQVWLIIAGLFFVGENHILAEIKSFDYEDKLIK